MQIVEPDIIFRLILSATLGGLIGIERQIQGQTAGFRTQLLVCVGACLFTISSIKIYEVYGKPVDPSRIAAQIVVGIGFLGAGAIIKHGDYIRGLTTAATLWVVSAIGMAVGLGDYSLSVFTTFLTLINLILLKKIESILPRDIYSEIHLEYDGLEFFNLEKIAREKHVDLTTIKKSFVKAQNLTIITATLKYKNKRQIEALLESLKKEEKIKKVILD